MPITMTQPGINENSFQMTSTRRAVFIHLPRRTKQLHCKTQGKEASNANVKISPTIDISLRITSKASLMNSGCSRACVCNYN